MVRPWTERPDVRRWTKGIFWSSDVSEHEDMHPSDLWRQPSRWPLSIVLLTWLSPSWNAVCLYTDLVRKDLLHGVIFHSFLALGIARNKNLKFPDSVPFPLPISWKVLRSLLAITGRNTDSDLSEQLIGEELTWTGSWTCFRRYRGSTCCLSILPIVPQNGPTFLPLECLDMVGHGRTGSGKGWTLEFFLENEACLEEGNCFWFPLLLAYSFSTWWVWLCLAAFDEA